MSYEDSGSALISSQREIPHYHGDKTRLMFVAAAVILIVAQSTGAELPLSTVGSVISAVVLVIAAGVTSPAQYGVHWVNGILSTLGSLIFGIAAVNQFRSGVSLGNPSFMYVEALALLSLIALYMTTKTIRGRTSINTIL